MILNQDKKNGKEESDNRENKNRGFNSGNVIHIILFGNRNILKFCLNTFILTLLLLVKINEKQSKYINSGINIVNFKVLLIISLLTKIIL